MYPFLLLLVAYVIGSVPSGLIVGRVFFNTDLRDYGSKNIGATNAYRVLGAPAGLCVLIADVGKGVLGVYLGQTAGNIYDPALTVYCMIMGGLLALIGHLPFSAIPVLSFYTLRAVKAWLRAWVLFCIWLLLRRPLFFSSGALSLA